MDLNGDVDQGDFWLNNTGESLRNHDQISLFDEPLYNISNNSTADNVTMHTFIPLLSKPVHMVALYTVAYFVVFCLAVVNNSLVVSVIIRNPQMRNVTNYFLGNLALADILVSLIVLPFTVGTQIFREWQFGSILCKAIPYLQAVSVSASVNTLAAVALERYFAIFYPQRSVISPRTAFFIICVIWLVPLCIQTPWAVYYNLEPISVQFHNSPTHLFTCYLKCSKQFQRGFFLGVVFLSCYLIPLSFITVCYSFIGIKVWKRSVAGIRGSRAERNIQRSKIRIVRMLITVALFFTFSWLPLYSLRMRDLFGPPIKRTSLVTWFLPIAQWMGSANSCVNPFVYCYFSEQFRQSILAVVRGRDCCGKLHVTPSGIYKG